MMTENKDHKGGQKNALLKRANIKKSYIIAFNPFSTPGKTL